MLILFSWEVGATSGNGLLREQSPWRFDAKPFCLALFEPEPNGVACNRLGDDRKADQLLKLSGEIC